MSLLSIGIFHLVEADDDRGYRDPSTALSMAARLARDIEALYRYELKASEAESPRN
jgi:hypothetical protein